MNSNRCESRGCSNTTEPASCSDDTIGESTGWGAPPSSEEHDGSLEGNYELEGSEESSSKSSSSENGKSNGSYCVEAGSRRERREKGDFIEGGLRRRKAYGLDILVNLDKDGHNENVKVGEQFHSIALRTRSCFGFKVRKMNTDRGTVSQPVCVDEEESDFPCDMKDSSSRHDSGDSCDSDSTTDDQTYKPRAWSSSKKSTQFNDGSDDDILSVKKDDDTNKVWNSKSLPANKHNQSGDFQKVHPKNCHEFHDIIKTKGRSARKSLDVFNILIDSIIADKELPSDQLDPPIGQLSHMPLNLKFGFEEPCLPERSEDEKELDKLWTELDFALRSNEIGPVDSNTVGSFWSNGLKFVMCYYLMS